MTLSTEQIAQIKSWISKRGFTHTDVQYEIIDHVASAIEEKMEQQPELDLEQAFSEVHKSFGVFGFSTIEDSINGRIRKQLFKAYLKSGKELLTGYKVLIPLLTILCLITFYQQLPKFFDIASLVIFYTFCFFSLLYSITYYLRKKHIKRYLSFKMAISFIFLITIQLFNVQANILMKLDPGYKIACYGILIIIAFSIYGGTEKMIQKTEKLHELYQSN
ncbi:hypothetical protein MATR_17050 [Marivirga tractuosa]|uniref:Uncharacterized protein n=1 Tax=Marivirga tractuosa (strain ATCC 23168 / DSM 4126 / NBRC 15989 / NCIMB 1408 / VKM B-1430 / H-43) TaxID=643867 RepID=E4TRD6_MARTH|nr:hypothetical protein [Marivirga tractuosa]ADR20670.1 hypothetical protein Ftrac_0668 [Marivirga tractuosa DSM 4126]BDD14880.1 hypothetical protein MATR_17050 [Marivirga tractuosa]